MNSWTCVLPSMLPQELILHKPDNMPLVEWKIHAPKHLLQPGRSCTEPKNIFWNRKIHVKSKPPSLVLDFSREISKIMCFLLEKDPTKQLVPTWQQGDLEKVYRTVGSGTSLAQCGWECFRQPCLGPLENGGHLRAEEKKNTLLGVILGKVIHRKYEIAPSPKLTRISWDGDFGGVLQWLIWFYFSVF